MLPFIRRYKIRDKIFKSKNLKWENICNDISLYLEKDYLVISVSHFEKSMESFLSTLIEKRIVYESVQTNWDSPKIDFKKLIDSHKKLLIHVNDKAKLNIKSKLIPLKIIIIVIEHHPINEQEKSIIQFAQSLPCKSEIIFYTHLKEHFMQAFGADRIIALMDMLGMEEDFIEHSAISSAIKSAQSKVKNKFVSDQLVISVEQWFQHNCPDLYKKIIEDK